MDFWDQTKMFSNTEEVWPKLNDVSHNLHTHYPYVKPQMPGIFNWKRLQNGTANDLKTYLRNVVYERIAEIYTEPNGWIAWTANFLMWLTQRLKHWTKLAGR